MVGVVTTAVKARSNAAGREYDWSDGQDDGDAEPDGEMMLEEEAHNKELERGAVGAAAGRSIGTGLGL
jgi:hypothetical protein